ADVANLAGPPAGQPVADVGHRMLRTASEAFGLRRKLDVLHFGFRHFDKLLIDAPQMVALTRAAFGLCLLITHRRFSTGSRPWLHSDAAMRLYTSCYALSRLENGPAACTTFPPRSASTDSIFRIL